MAGYELPSENVLLFQVDSIEQIKSLTGKYKDAALQIYKALNQRPKSIIVELNIYRKYAPILIEYLLEITKINKAAINENERVFKKTDTNSRKRWTDVEDNLLIEAVCSEGATPARISAQFGRTPSAINSRITYLVGVKRLSQKIAGKFIGEINGENVNGFAVGTVYKEE